MDFYIRDVDEYSKDLRQGNKFAPEWSFRMGVSGSSDSGKTTMLMNLLMGNKNIKEDGERYICCDDIVLIGKFLHEPKWIIVRDFFNELANKGEDVSFRALSPLEIPDVEEFDPNRATVVIFEDLMNMPKKIQERIADYFSSGRHSNVSPIYVSQRFFLIPKTIRENLTYISLHRGSGNLLDLKRIISPYGVSAGKRDQIDKKFFFEIINVLDQMIKSTSILLKNFFLKKISIWSLFPALTPNSPCWSIIRRCRFILI